MTSLDSTRLHPSGYEVATMEIATMAATFAPQVASMPDCRPGRRPAPPMFRHPPLGPPSKAHEQRYMVDTRVQFLVEIIDFDLWSLIIVRMSGY